MARRAPALAIRAAVLAAALAACAPTADRAPAPEPPRIAGHAFDFVDVLAPGAYARKGPAVAEGKGAAPGFWAAVPGLARAERGRVVNLANGAETDVALFRGRGAAIRLSPEAAKAIGVGARPVEVQVTALRREPRIAGAEPAKPAERRRAPRPGGL